jgi:hypothetical protein
MDLAFPPRCLLTPAQDSSHVRLIDELPLEIVDLRRTDFSASEGTARSM